MTRRPWGAPLISILSRKLYRSKNRGVRNVSVLTLWISQCRASPLNGRVHRIAIRGKARSKRPSRRAIRRTAASARPPKPTSAAPAKSLHRAVSIEDFDADAGLQVDIVERVTGGTACRSLYRCQRCLLQQSRRLRVSCRGVRAEKRNGRPREVIPRVQYASAASGKRSARNGVILPPGHHGQAPCLARAKSPRLAGADQINSCSYRRVRG
jgi:hypothetical protein